MTCETLHRLAGASLPSKNATAGSHKATYGDAWAERMGGAQGQVQADATCIMQEEHVWTEEDMDIGAGSPLSESVKNI